MLVDGCDGVEPPRRHQLKYERGNAEGRRCTEG